MASDASLATPRGDENHKGTSDSSHGVVTLPREESHDTLGQNHTHPQNPGSMDVPDEPTEEHTASGFNRLPSKVVERILYLADPNTFTSLALINREWRRISGSPRLYRLQLADCHAHGAADSIQSSAEEEDITQLRRHLSREAKRNLFDAFLRPRHTVVKLISSSTSSSSSFPQGEAFRFSFSSHGRLLLGLSSSRIFVLDLSGTSVAVRHELKTVRRPVSASILDDGSLLAVAYSEHRLNIYQLASERAQLIHTISLNGVPRVLEFSLEGTVLAVAYEGAIEVYAVGENALPTDRRAVRCAGVDSLAFSGDGLTLIGSSCGPPHSDIVTISPPLFADVDSDLTVAELRSRMWTTQILFPDIKHHYTHVTPVASTADDDAAWVVGYDLNMKGFRMIQVDEATQEDTYFVGPGADFERDEPGPDLIPAASEDGDLVALGFQDSEIRIYGLSSAPNQRQSTGQGRNRTRTGNPGPCQKHLESRTLSSNSDRLRKMVDGPKRLILGCPLTTVQGVTAMRWVKGLKTHGSPPRLVAVAPGGVKSQMSDLYGEEFPVDGGRISIFDFQCSPNDGEHNEVTIEVGEVEPTALPEPGSTLDVEVELERRRTTVNRRSGLGSSTAQPAKRRNNNNNSGSNSNRNNNTSSSRSSPPTRGHGRNSHSQPTSPVDFEVVGALPFLDSPYMNNSPRSQDSLHRAATAASNNRARTHYQNAPASREARSSPRSRRTRRRLPPHESDADNWVPPPPPYTPDPPAPLPDHLRDTLLPKTTGSGSGSGGRETGARSETAGQGSRLSRLETMISQNPLRRSISGAVARPATSPPSEPKQWMTRRKIVRTQSDGDGDGDGDGTAGQNSNIPEQPTTTTTSRSQAATEDTQSRPSQVRMAARNIVDTMRTVPESPRANHSSNARPISIASYEPTNVVGRHGPALQLLPREQPPTLSIPTHMPLEIPNFSPLQSGQPQSGTTESSISNNTPLESREPRTDDMSRRAPQNLPRQQQPPQQPSQQPQYQPQYQTQQHTTDGPPSPPNPPRHTTPNTTTTVTTNTNTNRPIARDPSARKPLPSNKPTNNRHSTHFSGSSSTWNRRTSMAPPSSSAGEIAPAQKTSTSTTTSGVRRTRSKSQELPSRKPIFVSEFYAPRKSVTAGAGSSTMTPSTSTSTSTAGAGRSKSKSRSKDKTKDKNKDKALPNLPPLPTANEHAGPGPGPDRIAHFGPEEWERVDSSSWEGAYAATAAANGDRRRKKRNLSMKCVVM